MHIITRLELGGAQENTLHTVRHLDRSRFDVCLVTGQGGLLDDEAREIPDLECHFLPRLARELSPFRDLAAIADLVGIMRRRLPDIVHTHSSKAGVLGRWAAWLAGVPVIVHSIHGFGFTPAQSPPIRALFRLAERVSAWVTTHFVAVSRANVTEGVRMGLFRREDVTVIRSGFPVAEFRQATAEGKEVRQELDFPEDCLLVGTVSCLKAQKDPLILAEVAEAVVAVVPNARFFIAGDGELRNDLEASLARRGLADHFRILGWRRDIPRLMASMDVLLHTSRWEGLPKVLPQALAVGVPVVATAVDGAPEAVRHGDTGFLAPPRDAKGLAEAVIRLLEDQELRRRMSRRGPELVHEFDVGFLVPAQERLYERYHPTDVATLAGAA